MASKRSSVYRPDMPRFNAEGKSIKYELPRGASMRLDCPPRCQALLGDPTVALYITEGQKKADALASQGACALALLGVYGPGRARTPLVATPCWPTLNILPSKAEKSESSLIPMP